MIAAIFDIDGTLIDSVDLHARAWQNAFAHFGYNFPFERIRSQIGKGGDQLMPVFLTKEQLDLRGTEIEEFRSDLFRKELLPQVKPFPKVRNLFQRLLHDGWKIALASSAAGKELQAYKEIAQITDLFDTETSSDDADKSKPHPDIFQAAMDRLGKISPGDCVVVGDSPYDAEAAGKARIRSVGFLCGGFPEHALRTAGFEVIYQGANQLFEKYEESLFFNERPGN